MYSNLPKVKITLTPDLQSRVEVNGVDIPGITSIEVSQFANGDGIPRLALSLYADEIEIEGPAEIHTVNRRYFMDGAMAAVAVFADLEPSREDVEAAGLFEKYIQDTYGKIDTAISPRPPVTDLRHEPPYPDHETAVVSLNSDMTVHEPTEMCSRQGPHPLGECKEFTGGA